ncbi:hypothetical protein GCM10023194_63560 [Planotetraspora phitsanulokensis]|uniref:Uncharacterized protein n=1 Tax=Planotetraspora phitsanulokensis TaxID=575192 RepID=A0A8J3U5K7_9ACTN|nr:hypothetical protein [Planotetraspora phitsanulokensis]GII37422.1 hypothetical protein Pph01_24250 [Planotetraspora phitsanulokensis]
MTVTLASLSQQTGLAVLDHLEQSVSIPVVDGLQAQGDLIVVPLPVIASSVQVRPDARWSDVPPEGVELLRGAAGGNPHTLVADPGTCRWTRSVSDSHWLAIGVFETSAVAYLLHPEHGATGCTPGTYVVRRQREFGGRRERLVAD